VSPVDTPKAHPVPLSMLEAVWLLRRLRTERDALGADMVLIEERIRLGYNGHLGEAHRLLGSDKAIAEGLISKLWCVVAAHRKK